MRGGEKKNHPPKPTAKWLTLCHVNRIVSNCSFLKTQTPGGKSKSFYIMLSWSQPPLVWLIFFLWKVLHAMWHCLPWEARSGLWSISSKNQTLHKEFCWQMWHMKGHSCLIAAETPSTNAQGALVSLFNYDRCFPIILININLPSIKPFLFPPPPVKCKDLC